MKRLLLMLLLLSFSFPATRSDNVDVKVNIKSRKALEKGQATEVTLIFANRPDIDPPNLLFAGEVEFLEKSNDGPRYRYRIKPRLKGSLTLSVEHKRAAPDEMLTSVEVWALDGASQGNGDESYLMASPNDRHQADDRFFEGLDLRIALEGDKPLRAGVETTVALISDKALEKDPPELWLGKQRCEYEGKDNGPEGVIRRYLFRVTPAQAGKTAFRVAEIVTPEKKAFYDILVEEVEVEREVTEEEQAETRGGQEVSALKKFFIYITTDEEGREIGQYRHHWKKTVFGTLGGVFLIVCYILLMMVLMRVKDRLLGIYATLYSALTHNMPKREIEEKYHQFFALESGKPLRLSIPYTCFYFYPHFLAPWAIVSFYWALFFQEGTMASESWGVQLAAFFILYIIIFFSWFFIVGMTSWIGRLFGDDKSDGDNLLTNVVVALGPAFVFFALSVAAIVAIWVESRNLEYILLVMLFCGGAMLKQSRLSYYKMRSPFPQEKTQKQLDLLKQNFFWKEIKRERNSFVAIPERNRFVRIYVECDGTDFHVAAIHLLNPLSPVPIFRILEIREALSRQGNKNGPLPA